jgi:hypothetical protein
MIHERVRCNRRSVVVTALMVYSPIHHGIFQNDADVSIASGCSKRPFSKAAASEEARRTLRYVKPLNDARTMLADFFSILLKFDPQPERARIIVELFVADHRPEV